MSSELIRKLNDYVETNIKDFHKARINKLKELNLKKLLLAKNPYMYKAKNIVTANDLVTSLASAFMASAEESIFGNWLEGLAIYVSGIVYGGHKSSAEGIDLEFDKDEIHYFVSIKSGPKWGNSSQIKKMKEYFVQAVRVFNTSRRAVATQCIEGCCYGKNNRDYDDSTHLKYCGEKFWSFISGEPNLYVDIIEPLGYKAKERNEEYTQEYGKLINKLTLDFLRDYCNSNGSINWEKIVKLNSSNNTSR